MHAPKPSIRRLAPSGLILLPALLGGPASLCAQGLRGTVLTAGSDEPIEGVTVALLASDSTAVAAVISDESGRFLMTAPWTGRFLIRGDRIGYTTVISPEIDLLPNDTVEVELRMDVEAVELAPLTIVSERAPLVLDARLARWGYYERRGQFGDRGSGTAHFISLEEIEKRHPGRVTDMLNQLSGLRVQQVGRRGMRIVSSRGGVRSCDFTVYLDGMRLRLDTDESINDYVSTLSLTGIEVYVRAPYPVEYAPEQTACGVVLVWTGLGEGRRGGGREPAP